MDQARRAEAAARETGAAALYRVAVEILTNIGHVGRDRYRRRTGAYHA